MKRSQYLQQNFQFEAVVLSCMKRILRAILNEMHYRKRNFLFKQTFFELGTFSYIHLETMWTQLKGNSLTKEVGKRTLTIHDCPISPYNGAQNG